MGIVPKFKQFEVEFTVKVKQSVYFENSVSKREAARKIKTQSNDYIILNNSFLEVKDVDDIKGIPEKKKKKKTKPFELSEVESLNFEIVD